MNSKNKNKNELKIKMKECKVIVYESGDIIDEVNSVEEGKRVINEYEKIDKDNGCYNKGFYALTMNNEVLYRDGYINKV